MGSIPDCLGAAKNQLGDEIVTVPGGLGMLSYQIFHSKNEKISKGSYNHIQLHLSSSTGLSEKSGINFQIKYIFFFT
jgi:hypothetical protein